MTEPTHMGHPDPAELQRIADGEDGAREEVMSHVESCAECRAEIDRIQRVTAALSLSSTPPASLSARIEARRAASLHVNTRARSRVQRFVLPIGLAAAAVLVLFVGRDETPAVSAEKGIPKPWPDVPMVVARSLFHGVMSDWSPATLDSALAAMESDSLSGINLRYDGMRADSSAANQLAERAATYLMSRGAKPERIRTQRSLIETRGRMPAGGVQVLVWTTAPRSPSEEPQRQP